MEVHKKMQFYLQKKQMQISFWKHTPNHTHLYEYIRQPCSGISHPKSGSEQLGAEIQISLRLKVLIFNLKISVKICILQIIPTSQHCKKRLSEKVKIYIYMCENFSTTSTYSKHTKIVAVTINTTKCIAKITPQTRILAKENLPSHI